MVTQPPLTRPITSRPLLTLNLLVYGETMQQHLSLLSTNMLLLDDRGSGGPRQRNRRVVDVVESVVVAESILSQDYVLTLLTHYADEYTPALNWNINASDTVREALSNACVTPFNADKIACI